MTIQKIKSVNEKTNTVQYEKSTPKHLIDDAEYVLATYYEDGHCRNEALKEGNSEERQECKDEIKQIRKWIRKWKLKTKEGN